MLDAQKPVWAVPDQNIEESVRPEVLIGQVELDLVLDLLQRRRLLSRVHA